MHLADLWFVLLTVGVFALLALGARGLVRLTGDLISPVLAAGLTLYLLVALLFPEGPCWARRQSGASSPRP